MTDATAEQAEALALANREGIPERTDQDALLPVRIELGCGQKKLGPDWIGVDLSDVCLSLPGRNLVHDLFRFPWPFEDGVADEVFASHFFEHIPGRLRLQWMAEVWRICKPGALLTLQFPYCKSVRASQDWDHEWPPLSEESFLYFNREWLATNKLDHGKYVAYFADFKLERRQRVLNTRMSDKHPDAKASQAITDWDAVDDLIVTLRVLKPGDAAARAATVPRAVHTEEPEPRKEPPI